MFFIKSLIFLTLYFIFYLILSLNTLLSIFCFVIIVFIICILFFQLQVEYITYLTLLLYLGGILIFFLFTALMLNNEYRSVKLKIYFSFENMVLLVFFCKAFFILDTVNFKTSSFKNNIVLPYLTSYIENNFYIQDIIKNHGDIISFLSLYFEQSILLLILGFILLFTMMSVIIITKK